MKILPTSFRQTFIERVLDLLWGQWISLGLSGHGARESRIIDLDALLLGTCTFGRYDPRLFDEMLDWLRANGWSINIQRVRSLLARHDFGCGGVISAVAALQADGAATAKWRRLSLCALPVSKPSKLEPLFFHSDTTPQPVFGNPEPLFEKYGFHRGKLDLRRLSRQPNPCLPSNLLYRLRGLFGVNARADIVAYLLTHADGHPPEMARRLGYFSKTVQMALLEMEQSGTILSLKKGREKHYRVDPADWVLLKGQPGEDSDWPSWVDWPGFFAALVAIWRLTVDDRLAGASVDLQAAEWQKLMSNLAPSLDQALPGQTFREGHGLNGEAYVAFVQKQILGLFAPPGEHTAECG